jgi:hypothetical protein
MAADPSAWTDIVMDLMHRRQPGTDPKTLC